MRDIPNSQLVLWALANLVELAILGVIVYRRTYRALPAFTGYLLVNVGQSILLLYIYSAWGYSSRAAGRLAWITQALLIPVRGLAVAELCARILGGFRGIWALAWRILTGCAALIVVYTAAVTAQNRNMAIYIADRGLELAIAVVIVALFVFARYYDLPLLAPERALAAGFCLYSCFGVLNNTLLEKLQWGYAGLWNMFQLVSFLASVCLWFWAVLRLLPVRLGRPVLIEEGLYQQLSPEINRRLQTLNNNLWTFWKSEGSRT
jgi:hypothetical protein